MIRRRFVPLMMALLVLLAPLLFGAEPSPNDPYNDRLPPGALARFGTTRFHHPSRLESIDVSPDGKLVVGTDGNIVCVWEASTGREIERFRDKAQGDVVAFTADGRTLLAAAKDGIIERWNVETGYLRDRVGPRQKKLDPYRWCHFSPDRRILVLTDGTDALLLDVASGDIVERISERDGVYRLVVSHDGKRVAGGSKDGIIRIWEIASDKEVGRLDSEQRKSAYPLCYSPDDKTILVTVFGAARRELRLVDVATGKTLFANTDAAAGGDHVVFAPDGKTFATECENTVFLCDARTGKEVHRLERHANGFLATPAFSADGRLLVTGGGDHVIEMWDTASGKAIVPAHGHHGTVTALAFSPDGKALASGGSDGVLIEWDLVQKKPRLRCPGHYVQVVCLAYTPDGQAIVSGDGEPSYGTDGREAQVRVWNRATGKMDKEFAGHLNGVRSLTFTPDGKGLVSTGNDARIRLWSPQSDKRLRQATVNSRYGHRVRVSPDGKTLVYWSVDGDVSLYTADTLEKVRTLREPARSLGYAFDALFLADGKTIVFAEGVLAPPEDPVIIVDKFDKVRVCFQDVATGRMIRETLLPMSIEHGQEPYGVLSPDGTLFAVGKDPYPAEVVSVCLWDTTTGTPLPPLGKQSGGIKALCFSPDGKMLASGGTDMTIMLWDVDWGRWEHLWVTLGARPKVANPTGRVLRAGGPEEVAFVAQHLKEARALEGQVGVHIALLDNDDFETRDKAARHLKTLGTKAEFALRLALEGELGAEARRGVREVLDALKKRPVNAAAPSPGAILLSLRVLEETGTPDCRTALEELARGEESSLVVRSARQAVARLNKQR